MSPYTCINCGKEYRTELALRGHICPDYAAGLREGYRRGQEARAAAIAMYLSEEPTLIKLASLGDLQPMRNLFEALRALPIEELPEEKREK